jgi:hypothetical protein
MGWVGKQKGDAQRDWKQMAADSPTDGDQEGVRIVQVSRARGGWRAAPFFSLPTRPALGFA